MRFRTPNSIANKALNVALPARRCQISIARICPVNRAASAILLVKEPAMRQLIDANTRDLWHQAGRHVPALILFARKLVARSLVIVLLAHDDAEGSARCLVDGGGGARSERKESGEGNDGEIHAVG